MRFTRVVIPTAVLALSVCTQATGSSTSLLILPDGKLVQFATPRGMRIEHDNQDLIRYLKRGIGNDAVLTGLFVDLEAGESNADLMPQRSFQVFSFPWSLHDATEKQFAEFKHQGKSHLENSEGPGLAAIAAKIFNDVVGDAGPEMSSPQSSELARGEFFAETDYYLAGYNVLQVVQPHSESVVYLVNTYAALMVRHRVVVVLGIETVRVSQEAETVWKLSVERAKKETVDWLERTYLLNAHGSIYPPLDVDTFKNWRGSLLYIRLLGTRNFWALLISVAISIVILIRFKSVSDRRIGKLMRVSAAFLPLIVSVPWSYLHFGQARTLFVRAIGPFSFPNGVQHLSVAFTETLLLPLWALACSGALCLFCLSQNRKDRGEASSAPDKSKA